jgi:hypothetical protein
MESASWGKFRNLLSLSFVVVCRTFAAVFSNLRYIFVTVPDSDCNARQGEKVGQAAFCGGCSEGCCEGLSQQRTMKALRNAPTW